MILLSFGSNLGDRLAAFRQAAQLLARRGVVLVGASSVYETEPFGVKEQPPFLNAVVEVATEATPAGLLATCLEVERLLGRQRLLRWGPRTLDLDVLYMSGVRCATPELTLPHPGLAQRAFVLVPLLELLGGRLPASLQAAPQWLAALAEDARGVRRYASFPWPEGAPRRIS